MNTTTEDLKTQFNDALRAQMIGCTYKHYKGGVYSVMGFTWLTETSELAVRYNRVAGPDFDYSQNMIEYARPLSIWDDEVKDDDGNTVTRFTKVRKVESWEPVPTDEPRTTTPVA